MRLALIVLCLIGSAAAAGTVTTQPATRPITIHSDDRGQLFARIAAPGSCQCDHWSLSVDDKRATGEYEINRLDGYFDGRLIVTFRPRFFRVTAWRYTHRCWQITAFTMEQTPGRVTAEWTLRTPAGMPDITTNVEGRMVADLIDACPGVLVMLNMVLAELGTEYDPGPYWRAVRANEPAPGWVSVKVASAIELLGSRSPRFRQMGTDEIEDLGWPAAVCLRRMSRVGMTCEQQRAVGCLLAEWPDAK